MDDAEVMRRLDGFGQSRHQPGGRLLVESLPPTDPTGE